MHHAPKLLERIH